MTSFPKAKIHRFNEDTSCAPPPGTYDPKLDNKVKGAVFLEKAKRFPEQQCISTSLEGLDKPNPQVTFRTPQMTRKVHLTGRLNSLRDSRNFSTGSSTESLKTDFKTAGKADFIRADYRRLEQEMTAMADKHLSQVNKLNTEISQLQEDLNALKAHEAELQHFLEEKSAMELERSKELINVKNSLDTISVKINIEREEHTKYIRELKEEISQLQARKEDLEGVLSEKLKAIVNINDKYLRLESELKVLREENDRYKEDIVELNETHVDMLNNIVEASGKKINKLDHNLRLKVSDLVEQFDVAQEKMQSDFAKDLNSVYQELESTTEPMKAEMEKCLETFHELKRFIEKSKNDFTRDLLEVDERCRYLYRELCKVERERDELLTSDLNHKLEMEVIKEKTDALQRDLNKYREKSRKYDITLNTMQNSIQALSDRLMESENEVERLSQVKVDLENQKTTLEENKQQLMDDIAFLRETMEQMESDVINDVTNIREEIEMKLEVFKTEAANQVSILNGKVQEKQYAIDLLFRENDFYKRECEKKNDSLRCLEEKAEKYVGDISNLKKERSRIEDEFSERLTAQRNLYNILNNNLGEANNAVGQLKQLNLDLESNLTTLTHRIAEITTKNLNLEKELSDCKTCNLEQATLIKSLEKDVESGQEIIKTNKVKVMKQKQYIDELASELVLEKERSIRLEQEKEEVQELLSKTKDKSDEMENLTLDLQRSLRNAEEKIEVTEEANSILESQLRESENNNNELKNKISMAEEEYNTKLREVQAQLVTAKERIKSEIPNLQSDNINKAEYILELSMKIDSLNETITSQSARISCLEAEKCSLQFQLEDAFSKVSSLEGDLDAKKGVINNLTNCVNVLKLDYEKAKGDMEKWLSSYNQLAEESKLSADNVTKLIDAEELIAELQKVILIKDKEIEKRDESFQESEQLREEVEILRMRVQVITEERDKLDQEVAELMGHQNTRQKIKHVNHLKQINNDLRENCDKLEIENAILKKKLADSKENTNLNVLPENTPKTVKKKRNAPSPAVLKDRNCL